MHTDTHRRIAGSTILLRLAQPEDGPGMWALATSCGLDVNAPYAYALWGRHHSRTTLVAERESALVGFTLGYLIPGSARDLFIWQIGVHSTVQSTGIASLMLDTLCASVQPRTLEATVEPSNQASDALFRSFARRHDATVTTSGCFGARHFPVEHEDEVLYRIDLLPGRDPARQPTTRGETFLGAV